MVIAKLIELFRLARRDERGQGLVEYALIIALVALVVIGALTFLGGSITDLLQGIGDCLADVATCGAPAP